MRVVLLACSLLLSACGSSLNQCGSSSKPIGHYDPSVPHPPLEFYGTNNSFQGGSSPAFGGITTVESSLLNVDGKILALHDPTYGTALYLSDLGANGLSFLSLDQVDLCVRFPYTMAHGGIFYTFGLKDQDIYVWESSDLKHWQPSSQGKPVLTHSEAPGSPYNQLWNVGVAVDDHRVWHMLVESSDATAGQRSVGLTYAKAQMVNGVLNFDLDRSTTQVIPHGGNPDVKFVSGRGLLVTHGQVFDPVYGVNSWYTTMSTLETGHRAWQTHKDKVVIGLAGDMEADPVTAVADPSLVELSDGTTLMTLSVAQDSVYLVHSTKSLKKLFDELN